MDKQAVIFGISCCLTMVLGAELGLQKTTPGDCLSAADQMRQSSRKPLYVPNCDPATGLYLSKQCNRRGECWCVDTTDGTQLGARWGDPTPLASVAAAKDPTLLPVDRKEPHVSCDIVASYWNDWKKRGIPSQ